jgi:FtsH-binding integral membrane protein
MEAVRIKKAWKAVKFHAKIAWRGFYRTVYGSLVAGLAAMAAYGFVSVTTETGWTAVCDFIASCATLLVAFSNMYLMGCKKKGGAKNG